MMFLHRSSSRKTEVLTKLGIAHCLEFHGEGAGGERGLIGNINLHSH